MTCEYINNSLIFCQETIPAISQSRLYYSFIYVLILIFTIILFIIVYKIMKKYKIGD